MGLQQTIQTAAFAFREYFRPITATACFLKSKLVPSASAELPADNQAVRSRQVPAQPNKLTTDH